MIWKYGGVDCGYVDETYDGLEDDENGRMYTYAPVIDIPGIELIKMTLLIEYSLSLNFQH